MNEQSSPAAWLLQQKGKLPEEDHALLERAVGTLLGNIPSSTPENPLPWHPRRGIIPSYPIFQGIWNWDTAFHAMAVSRWDAALGREQIEMFLDLMQPSGLLPDVLFANGELVKGFGKPPVMPWAAMIVDQREPNDAFLARAYPSFLHYEEFWRKNRGGDQAGLFHYDSSNSDPAKRLEEAKYESGWDNSVRWDDGIYELWPVDLNCYMVMLYRAMSGMAKRLKRDTEIVRWETAAAELSQRIESTLWSPEAGAYLDYDFGRKTFIHALTPASFMPLYIGIASPRHAASMARIAQEKFHPGWPTVAYDHPQFDPNSDQKSSYWRGRTWLNVAYFALKGLKDYGFDEVADAGRKTLLDWARRDGSAIYENYDSKTGRGCGAKHFSWSAAFVIEFLLHW